MKLFMYVKYDRSTSHMNLHFFLSHYWSSVTASTKTPHSNVSLSLHVCSSTPWQKKHQYHCIKLHAKPPVASLRKEKLREISFLSNIPPPPSSENASSARARLETHLRTFFLRDISKKKSCKKKKSLKIKNKKNFFHFISPAPENGRRR